jgi:hypothetical protein
MTKIPLFGTTSKLPPAPDWMIQYGQQLKDQGTPTVQQTSNTTWLDDIVLKKGNEWSLNATNINYMLDQSCHDWCYQNIHPSTIDVRYSSTRPGLPRSGPHSDRTRNFTMIYLLRSGGPDHRTVFYQQNGNCPVVREPKVRVDNYDELTELASIQLPLHTWVMLNASVIHSVENISQGRDSIQINLESVPSDLNFNWTFYQE